MKRIVLSICLLMAFVCLTSFPANAGMELTIINGTSMELNKLTMEAEEGNMTVSVNIVPNNKVTLSDGNTSTVTGLKVIIGDQCYQFENMKLLGPEQNIKFALQNDGIPILQPQGETSDNSQAAITGTVTSLISKESPADLAQVLAATTMGALSELGLQEAPSFTGRGEFIMPIKFAGITWMAWVSPDHTGDTFGTPEDELAVGTIVLHAVTENKAVSDVLTSLSKMEYRPWFSYAREGAEMNIVDTLAFWKDELVSDQATGEVVLDEVCNKIFGGIDEPMALETLFLPQDAWQTAAEGENPTTRAAELRVSSSKSLTLILLPYAADFVDASRKYK